MDFKQWQGFQGETWKQEINVRNFIKKNYTPYLDDPDFLCGPTERTKRSMDKLNALLKEEMDKGGVLDIDVTKTSTLTSHAPGYLDKDTDIIVGLQTDAPLRRAVLFQCLPCIFRAGGDVSAASREERGNDLLIEADECEQNRLHSAVSVFVRCSRSARRRYSRSRSR